MLGTEVRLPVPALYVAGREVNFLVGALGGEVEDEQVGQAICGFAFWVGQEIEKLRRDIDRLVRR